MPTPRLWNVTDDDLRRTYACERYGVPGAERWLRAVDVEADPSTVFAWLCQIRVAPYSYDLVDNLGRRSPRTLTPGLQDLAVGQRFAGVLRIVDFEPGRQITATTRDSAGRLFGMVAMTYDIRATASGSRLVGALSVGADGPWQRASRGALAWGDLVMMRKQLQTLRDLAERDVRPSRGAGPATPS